RALWALEEPRASFASTFMGTSIEGGPQHGSRGRTRHRGIPLFGPGFSLGVGGRGRARLHVELGQDPADVVLDRLRPDEEPLPDLGVRQTEGQEREDFLLPRAEELAPAWTGRSGDSERAEHRSRRVDVAGGAETLERRERRARGGPRRFRAVIG